MRGHRDGIVAAVPEGTVPCYGGRMTNRIADLAQEAEKLPAADRIRLVEHLLGSLDKPEPDIDAAWAEESERRLDAYLAGEASARDADEVLAKYLKP
jgi:putative addiction module component (TIGR02574 family)